MTFITSIARQPGDGESQDRGDIIELPGRIVLAVTDGAGGIAGGARAAEEGMRIVRESAARLNTPADCTRLLASVDTELSRAPNCGETTGVIVVVSARSVFGASVGDSEASILNRGVVKLTHAQRRKPFLGSGGAMPVSFASNFTAGTLIVATDGLWKYTNLERILDELSRPHSQSLASSLVDLVRLRSGTFQDDVTVITCLCSNDGLAT